MYKDHFITEQDRRRGAITATISVRRGEAVFEIIGSWVQPKGNNKPHSYHNFATSNLRRPFMFHVIDMPIERWELLLALHGQYLNIRR